MTQEVESARTNPHWYREAIIYQAHVAWPAAAQREKQSPLNGPVVLLGLW